MVHACSPSSQEAEAGEAWSAERVRGQPGLCGATDMKAPKGPARSASASSRAKSESKSPRHRCLEKAFHVCSPGCT